MRGFRVVGEKEEPAGTGPERVEGGVGLEEVRAVGPEGAVPGAVDSAVDEGDGFSGVEEQGGAGGELAIDEDEVVAAGVEVLGLEDVKGQ